MTSKLRISGTNVARLTLKGLVLSKGFIRESEPSEERINRKVETALGKIKSPLEADSRDVEPPKSTSCAN